MPKPKQTVRLRPADPFDLIRWLARTQSDPRKAVAELVQNSIDAKARRVRIERRRVRGAPCLFVRDDGDGILRELDREAALRHIATHIGYSHKRGLSPRQRQEEVIAGKYGIGLLGFWAIGRHMEMRSRVGGAALHVLRMHEDDPAAEIASHPVALDAPPAYTEIAVLELHEAALRPLGGRRLAEYLAAELRGPILASGCVVEVHDAMARGTAQKRFQVLPRAFPGERLELPEHIDVAGHAPARVELYLARGQERPSVQLACAGTIVADDIGALSALGFDAAPWTGCDLTGVIDFPGFTVPPGTRRGVVPDAAAAAFVRAIEALEPLVRAELARLESVRRAAIDRQIVDELRRALRGLRNRLPHYELPAIAEGHERDAPAAETTGAPLPPTSMPEVAPDEEVAQQPELLPPGPLASVRIVPEQVEVPAGAERRVHAVCTDDYGVRVGAGIELLWALDGVGFRLLGGGARPAVAADSEVRPGSQARLLVTAQQGLNRASATATVVAVEALAGESERGLGVPRPELIDDPTGGWRSRLDGERWQVNASHEDYVALSRDARARVRYLLLLLSKEIVQRNYGAPGTELVLERLVEVLAHAERNLRGG